MRFRKFLVVPFIFLQHNDIHFGFSSFAWHRDSVNRKHGDFPDWEEDKEEYQCVRVGYYFQEESAGFKLGMISWFTSTSRAFRC